MIGSVGVTWMPTRSVGYLLRNMRLGLLMVVSRSECYWQQCYKIKVPTCFPDLCAFQLNHITLFLSIFF